MVTVTLGKPLRKYLRFVVTIREEKHKHQFQYSHHDESNTEDEKHLQWGGGGGFRCLRSDVLKYEGYREKRGDNQGDTGYNNNIILFDFRFSFIYILGLGGGGGGLNFNKLW